MFAALKGENADYAGTLEFFPDEGKYHLDGHRACNVMLEPLECMKLNNICPVCGKPLTVGVLHRVLELADRTAPPEPGRGFRSLIPLAEILGELLHCGPKTAIEAGGIDITFRIGSGCAHGNAAVRAFRVLAGAGRGPAANARGRGYQAGRL